MLSPTSPTSPPAAFSNLITEHGYTWDRLAMLGQGSYGTVHRGIASETGQPIAVKEMCLRTLRSQSQSDRHFAKVREQIIQEATVHRPLDHRNVVRCLDSFILPDPFGGERCVIVLEFCNGQTLAQSLRDAPFMDDLRLADMLTQLASGLHYLHQRHIIHRDLKPANIIWHRTHPSDPGGEQLVLKIVDFGLARDIPDNMAETELGSPFYLAPEVLRENREVGQGYSYTADTWSVGVIMYFAIFNEVPFRGQTKAMIQSSIRRFASQTNYLQVLQTKRNHIQHRDVIAYLLGRLLDPIASTRLTLPQLLEILDRVAHPIPVLLLPQNLSLPVVVFPRFAHPQELRAMGRPSRADLIAALVASVGDLAGLPPTALAFAINADSPPLALAQDAPLPLEVDAAHPLAVVLPEGMVATPSASHSLVGQDSHDPHLAAHVRQRMIRLLNEVQTATAPELDIIHREFSAGKSRRAAQCQIFDASMAYLHRQHDHHLKMAGQERWAWSISLLEALPLSENSQFLGRTIIEEWGDHNRAAGALLDEEAAAFFNEWDSCVAQNLQSEAVESPQSSIVKIAQCVCDLLYLAQIRTPDLRESLKLHDQSILQWSANHAHNMRAALDQYQLLLIANEACDKADIAVQLQELAHVRAGLDQPAAVVGQGGPVIPSCPPAPQSDTAVGSVDVRAEADALRLECANLRQQLEESMRSQQLQAGTPPDVAALQEQLAKELGKRAQRLLQERRAEDAVAWQQQLDAVTASFQAALEAEQRQRAQTESLANSKEAELKLARKTAAEAQQRVVDLEQRLIAAGVAADRSEQRAASWQAHHVSLSRIAAATNQALPCCVDGVPTSTGACVSFDRALEVAQGVLAVLKEARSTDTIYIGKGDLADKLVLLVPGASAGSWVVFSQPTVRVHPDYLMTLRDSPHPFRLARVLFFEGADTIVVDLNI